MRPLDLQRYPDGLQRQRWRLTLWHTLAGALLGAGLCRALLLWVPTAQEWEARLAVMQARAQAQADAQQRRQREQVEAERERQALARWMDWDAERERLVRLWSLLEGAADVDVQGFELGGGRALLHIRAPDESALDRLQLALTQARLGHWRVQQQSVAMQNASLPSAATAAGPILTGAKSGWGFVLQADWPQDAASNAALNGSSNAAMVPKTSPPAPVPASLSGALP